MKIEASKSYGNYFKWIFPGVVIFFCIIAFCMSASYQNSEVSLRNEFEAQEKKIEAVHDAMWKIIQQKAGVQKEYAKDFDNIYKHIMDSRYDKSDNVVFNWIKESNPEFSSDMYKDLCITIEVQRKQFLGAQERIIDIMREHNTLLESVPAKWFLGGIKKLDYEVISSSVSKSVMETRMDDNVDLYGNP
jgi:hypothetical protein